ncbi:hypothetical protein C8039_10100 [Halogeometricum sp. wsp3]|nr:hypothetical protein C8039_10100 [Halogeometricum sp. wsp3]
MNGVSSPRRRSKLTGQCTVTSRLSPAVLRRLRGRPGRQHPTRYGDRCPALGRPFVLLHGFRLP